MKNGWLNKRLDECILVNPHESLPKGTRAKKVSMDKLQPFYRDVPEYEYAEYSGGAKFKNGDTIMARITPCLENGKTAMVNVLSPNEVGFGSTEFIVFRAKEGYTTPDYVYYLVTSPLVREPAIKSMVGSSGRQRVQTDVVKNLELPFSSLPEQEKIASTLKSLDDKIALNNAINKNLEEQAQAIYADYIDSHQTSHVTLDQVVLSANTGADAIQKAPIVDYDTGVRCVRVGDMSNNRPFHEWGFTEVTPSVYKQYQLHEGDIVVTRTATLGLNRLIANDIDAVYNNGLIRLCIDTNEALPIIVYRQFQTEDFKNYISRISGETSVRPNMKINYLLKYEFEIIPLQEQRELASMLSPLFELQEMLIHQNQKLALLRDSLLPKLMSGEIDVSNVSI